MPTQLPLPLELCRRRAISLTAWLLLLAISTVAASARASEPAKKAKSKSEPSATVAKPSPVDGILAGLNWRSIGPALSGGRISEIAVDPRHQSTWYVGFASGGVMKTTNSGTTWTAIFDEAGSYSIGTITIDPQNSNVVWVGTGEHNSQRSVSYGDGVYRSDDAGKSWRNLGLKDSAHIGRILIDPRDSDVVYVAAHGPLWSSGGDRGLYKTTDGGKTWAAILTAGPDTGVNDVAFHPRDPDLLYASTYQRRRHEWGLVHGGPEAAFHRSTDGGKTWTKIESGLPSEDKGRIAIAVAPSSPDVVYLVIEAALGKGGTFRSTDRGVSFTKRSSVWSSNGQYYTRAWVDLFDADRIYLADTFTLVSDDGGTTYRRLGQSYRHVDDHALWLDPANPDHYLVGGDGGLYETFDRAENWAFFDNLGAIQFYKIGVDDARPFYNVYGGTQDNFSLGGPSRTTTRHGITNRDWFVLTSGDGFEPQVDPTDPNVVYVQAQYGSLVRYDRRNGEELFIQPQAEAGEILKWNWDSPLLLSPHSPSRLYYAANRLFRSDDRGNSWRAISGDLTRGIDRNTRPMMGKVWSVDAVAKNANTTFFGNATALAESPRVEGLLYVGTDDGLIHVSEDGGSTWRRVETFPGVAAESYVAALTASQHDDATVYAVFNNHKQGDFRPYVLRSSDRGRSWSSVVGDLPVRGSTWDLIEDYVDRNLLFAGTEFGVYASTDGGSRWRELGAGLPTIAARDLEIQPREDDLVVGTFGRGIYILDDYAPLRSLDRDAEREVVLYPTPTAVAYVPSSPLGYREKAFQGDSMWSAANPPFGAVFTYALKDELQSLAKVRREGEKKKLEAGETLVYPSWDALRAEDREEAPAMVLTVSDESGNVLRRLVGPAAAGLHRVAWDLRLPASDATDLSPPEPNRGDPYVPVASGPLAAPGRYRVALAKRVDGVDTAVGEPQTFNVVSLASITPGSQPSVDAHQRSLAAFTAKVARLQRAVSGAVAAADEAQSRLDHLRQALTDTPNTASTALAARRRELDDRLKELRTNLDGDSTVARRNEPTPSAITDRVNYAMAVHWSATAPVTATAEQAYSLAADAFSPLLAKLRQLLEVDLPGLEQDAEKAGAPWTPQRALPAWNRE